MHYKDSNRRLAVLIDAENTSHNHLPNILKAINAYGRPVIKRAYADWMQAPMQVWRPHFAKYDIVPVQALQIVSGKNLSDIAMVIDAMDLLYDDNVSGFCIVSSDSDFTPLVHRLRDGGRFVMGVGRQHTSDSFITACDVFLSSTNYKNNGNGQPQTKEIQRKLQNLLVQAAKMAGARQNKYATLSAVGQSLKKINDNFNIKDYGHSSLSDSVRAFPELLALKKRDGIDSVRLLKE